MRSLTGLLIIALLLTGCAQETMFIKHRVDNCDRIDLDTARLWKIAGEASKSKDSTLRLNSTKYQFLGGSVSGDFGLKETRGRKAIEYSVHQQHSKYDYITAEIKKNNDYGFIDGFSFDPDGTLRTRYTTTQIYKTQGANKDGNTHVARMILQEYLFDKTGQPVRIRDYNKLFKFKADDLLVLYAHQLHETITDVRQVLYDTNTNPKDYKVALNEYAYQMGYPYYVISSLKTGERQEMASVLDGNTGKILKTYKVNIASVY